MPWTQYFAAVVGVSLFGGEVARWQPDARMDRPRSSVRAPASVAEPDAPASLPNQIAVQGEAAAADRAAESASRHKAGVAAQKPAVGRERSGRDAPRVAHGPAKSPVEQRSATFEGTVVLVVPSKVTLSQQGRWTTFLVPPDATIRVNSAEAPLEEVVPGHYASVVGQAHGGELVATLIDAKRQY